jgi:hypothetical protein
MGAGPGPEALAPGPLNPGSGMNALSSMLVQAARASGSVTLSSLAQRAQAAGL